MAQIATGSSDPKALTKTIVALDPAVATPVSQVQQEQTIQAEASAFATSHDPDVRLGRSRSKRLADIYGSKFSLQYLIFFRFRAHERHDPTATDSCRLIYGSVPSQSSDAPSWGNLNLLCWRRSQDGFESAALDITASSTLSSLICAQPEPNESDSSIHPQQVALNGTNFYESHLNDAGLGHDQSTDSYRTYHEGVCYTMDLKIDSDRGNSTGLSPDFSAMMSAKLQSVFDLFKFTR